jgi:hypothetical protein
MAPVVPPQPVKQEKKYVYYGQCHGIGEDLVSVVVVSVPHMPE